jgi:phage terminase large subunit-like protein
MDLNNNIIPEDLFQSLTKDKVVRREVMRGSFNYFFHFYFAHYVQFPTAPFQKHLILKAESDPRENMFVVAFRGSGKSTIITTAYPIWAILGLQQKKFVVIFCQTRGQAKQHMMNIRNELENNPILKSDLGPFDEESDEWGSQSLVFSNTQARITVASTEQSIRGLRHHQHRPDLIICDDVEDVASTKTREGRNKTYQWLTGDVIPSGDQDTRLIIVGNLLHEDSLLMRIRERVMKNEIDGVFISCPLIDSQGKCAWLGKFPDHASIDRERKKSGDEVAWQREYLLNIIPDDDQVIHHEWIQYYDITKLPPVNHITYRATYTGADLAISAKDTADNTAFVTMRVFGRKEFLRVFVLPNPVNAKLTFPQQVEYLKLHSLTELTHSGDVLFVENTGYQDALTQILGSLGIKTTGVRPQADKRTRLALTATLVKNGIILFPNFGCTDLIQQIVGFGVEKHDDLADAFSMLVLQIIERHCKEGEILMGWLGGYGYESEFILATDYKDVLVDYDCIIKPILK